MIAVDSLVWNVWEKTAVRSSFGVIELTMSPCGPEPHMDVTGGCRAELLLALRSVVPCAHLKDDNFWLFVRCNASLWWRNGILESLCWKIKVQTQVEALSLPPECCHQVMSLSATSMRPCANGFSCFLRIRT